MAAEMRIGLLHSNGDLSQSIAEQRLGAQLAASYTQENPDPGAESPVLVERAVANEEEVASALEDLVSGERCSLLLGALNVPISIRAAQWAEAAGVLYTTANNNPLVGGGRRHVFHIGVPSEVTG